MPVPAPSTRPLAGRHAFVTGASRGIGLAIAGELARLGADVTLAARTGDALARQARALAETHGIRAHAQALDVLHADAVRDALAEPALGPVALLVNNAGAGRSVPFHKMDEAHWRDMVALNLDAVFRVTRAAIPGMLAAGFGRIVTVASTAGLTGYPYVAAYCAAKHGAVGLMRALAREYATRGIAANAVCPGFADTEMTAETVRTIVAKTGRSEAEARAELVKANPQGRLVRPQEIAAVVGWLMLPEAAAITGQAIAVAGGEVMA